MTLAMALRAIDGLVLATDSRVSGKRGTADNSEKFMQVNRDIGVMTYGLAEPGYEGISRLVLEVTQNRLAHFSKIADKAATVFQDSCTSWLERQEHKRLGGPTGFILAGYDSLETNQFRIMHYEITPDPEQPFRFMKAAFSGDLLAAQWHLARYLLNKLYYPEMTVNELAELAVFIVAETMTVQTTVGGPIQMATINQTVGFERVDEDDLVRMLQSQQKKFVRFRQVYRSVASEQPVEGEGQW